MRRCTARLERKAPVRSMRMDRTSSKQTCPTCRQRRFRTFSRRIHPEPAGWGGGGSCFFMPRDALMAMDVGQ